MNAMCATTGILFLFYSNPHALVCFIHDLQDSWPSVQACAGRKPGVNPCIVSGVLN